MSRSTKVQNIDIPWLKVVQDADQDWAAKKHRELEYEFPAPGRNLYADPYKRGAYGTRRPSVGALNRTLAPLTVFGRAQAFQGALSQILGDLTVSAAGAVAITGQTNVTLLYTLPNAAGTVTWNNVDLDLDVTLGELTAVGAGVVGADIIGEASSTLDPATLSAAGVVPILGALDRLLSPMTLVAFSGSGSTGVLAQALAPVTSTGFGHTGNLGALGATLGTLVLSGATGRVLVKGQLAQTLEAAASVAAGAVAITGRTKAFMQMEDGSFVLTEDGKRIELEQSLGIVLDDITLGSDSVAPRVGALAQELGALTSTAAGSIPILGDAAITLDDVFVAQNSQPIGLLLALAFPTGTAPGGGGSAHTGDLAQTLLSTTSVASGVVAIQGALSQQLEDATKVTMTGVSGRVGAASITLGNVGVSAAGSLGPIGVPVGLLLTIIK